jgi:hypothetical protein
VVKEEEARGMDGRDFFNKVREHPKLEWLGVREGRGPEEDEILVQFTGTGAKYALRVEAVLDHGWPDLEAALTGRRQALIMTHLSRIVGYFSQVRNWNRSKIAELRDRQRGQYALPEAGRASPAGTVVPMREGSRVAVA